MRDDKEKQDRERKEGREDSVYVERKNGNA